MARVGQRAGVEGLYWRFAGPIYSFNFAMLDNEELALKATEKAFLQALRAREDICDATELPAWMYGIALGKCREILENIPHRPLQARPNPSAQDVINGLEPGLRAAALLKSAGFEPPEVASISGITGEIPAVEMTRRNPPVSIWGALDRTLTAQRAMRSTEPARPPAAPFPWMIVLAVGMAILVLGMMIVMSRRV